ncbi:hypothetical protein [Sporisorium scitamineum]|uniref:Uncharacterized protein n=1 Tax=Sporisorium scitamineum TaxID=49012 RepID=A0A0F7S8G7_9BASI|nr:hypothetical protein [Sporisorium scitamineum]
MNGAAPHALSTSEDKVILQRMVPMHLLTARSMVHAIAIGRQRFDKLLERCIPHKTATSREAKQTEETPSGDEITYTFAPIVEAEGRATADRVALVATDRAVKINIVMAGSRTAYTSDILAESAVAFDHIPVDETIPVDKNEAIPADKKETIPDDEEEVEVEAAINNGHFHFGVWYGQGSDFATT